MKKDLVIGIVGTLILVVAMIGVFRFEASQAGGAYNVTWATSEVAGPAVDGGTNEGQSSAESVNISTPNITRIVFVLEWTDEPAGTDPDEFLLSVTSPTGETKEATGNGGSVEVVFENVNPTPAEATILAADDAAAGNQLNSTYMGRAGLGAWNVTVTLTQAGDQRVPNSPANVPPIAEDTSNAWTLTPRMTVYTGQATRA